MVWLIRIFPFVIFFLVSSLSSLYAHPVSTSVNTSGSTALGLVLGGMGDPPPPTVVIILKGSAVMGTGSAVASTAIPAAAIASIRNPDHTPENLVGGQGQSDGGGGRILPGYWNPGDGAGPATGEFDEDEWKVTLGAGYFGASSELKLGARYRYSDEDSLGNESGGQGQQGSGESVPNLSDEEWNQWRNSLNLGGLKTTEVLKGPQGHLFGSGQQAGAINVTLGAGGNDRLVQVPAQFLIGRQVLDFGGVAINDFDSHIVTFQNYANPWNLGAEFTRKTDIALAWNTGIYLFGTFGDLQASPEVKSRFEAFAGAAIFDVELNALIIIAPAPGLDPSTWPDTDASPVARAHVSLAQMSWGGDN